MEAERWQRVQDLYFAALGLAPPARPGFLDEASAGDPTLRAEVERLVALDARAGDFLERPPWGAIPPALGAAGAGTRPLAPGTVVGRYRIDAPLGTGGMGTVYSAHDPELDREVALKLVLPYGGGSAEGLLREAQALARIADPHVVTVHDAGRHGDGVFLAMELAGGGTLEDWLRAGARTWREILAAFLQAARGLAAAHRAGVVHRDFKPANVLRGAGGTLRVADFGLARAGEREEAAAPPPDPASPSLSTEGPRSTRAAMGTPSFMAPEQYLGGEVGPHTDQFAFAVALHEALYGSHPFPSFTLAELRARVLAGRVAEAPQGVRVPRRLRAVLLRALAVDPGRRWASMSELIGELEAVAARRGRALAGAAGLLVAAVVAAAYFSGRPGPVAAPPRSVAVLPFVAESGDPAVAALAEGLTDELIRALVRIEALAVPARTSVFALRDRGMPPSELARRLGVAHLLEGRVHQEDGRLRVTVRCLAATGGEPLWSESFDRPQADLFRVQEELARTIIDRLDVELAGPEPLVSPGTESLDAYSFYLRGRQEWNRRNAEGLHQAVAYFERSLEADERYALAYSGLADAYSLMVTYLSEPAPDALAKAHAAARRSLELAPDLAETHTSLASVLLRLRDYPGAEAELRRALDLNPRYSTARHWYGHLLLRIFFRLREGVDQLELARRLDPASAAILAVLGSAYYDVGRHTDGLTAERALHDLDPHWATGACTARFLVALRRTREAIEEIETLGGGEDRSAACWTVLAEAHHLAADYASELSVAREGLRHHPQNGALVAAQAAALAALGRPEQAMDLMAPVVAGGPKEPGWYYAYQVLGELRVHGHRQAARELGARWLAPDEALPDEVRGSIPGTLTLAEALLEQGRFAEGLVAIRRATRESAEQERIAQWLSPAESTGLEAWAAALAGDRDEARRMLARIETLEAPSWTPPYPVFVFGALGEHDAAIARLRRHLTNGLVAGRDLHLHLGLEPLRCLPASRALEAEFSLPVAACPLSK